MGGGVLANNTVTTIDKPNNKNACRTHRFFAFGLAVVFTITALAVGLGVGLGRGGSGGPNLGANPPIPSDTPLFTQTGVNLGVAEQLAALARHPNDGGAARSFVTVDGITHLSSNFNQIQAAHNNTTPNVKIFETVGTPVPGYVNSAGATQPAHANQATITANFTNLGWRLMYITHPPAGGDPVFTFWADGAYRNHHFNPSAGGSVWATSALFNRMQLDFDAALSSFPHVRTGGFLRSAQAIPGNWVTWNRNSTQSTFLGDRHEYLSLLSIQHYIFPANARDRTFNENGFLNAAFPRHGTGSVTTGTPHDLGSNGNWVTAGSSNVPSRIRAVVPFIHLSLAATINAETIMAGFQGTNPLLDGQISPIVGGVGAGPVWSGDVNTATLRFSVVPGRELSHVTINGINIGITGPAGSIERHIVGVTRYEARWENYNRTSLVLRVWDIHEGANLDIRGFIVNSS